MEELVNQIISVLKRRETREVIIPYEENHCMPSSLFVKAKHLHIEKVDLFALQRLVNLDEDSPWVQSIVEGISYDVVIHLHLNVTNCQLIPKALLCQWPLLIYEKNGCLIQSFTTNSVTAQQVATFDKTTLLLLWKKQRLTALAQERLEKKDVKWIERVME